MHILFQLFGEGKDLTILQMSCRGAAVFIITLLLIRLSGRRSFGIHTPLDNIITITLGAILSRAVVGASGFLPVVVCSAIIVTLHRFFGWLIVHNATIQTWVEGRKIVLYENGEFVTGNFGKALVCKEDIMEGVRKSALTEDLGKIDRIYMERNGDISAIRKD